MTPTPLPPMPDTVRVVKDPAAKATELNTGLQPLPHPKAAPLAIPAQQDPLAAARAIFHKIANYGYVPSPHDGMMGLDYLAAVEKELDRLRANDQAHDRLHTERLRQASHD